jgi:alginate O-acetyltransferase complex protein AlgI
MLFNSFAFAAFLPLCFALYWAAQRHLRVQNLVVMLASFVFYGWWDPRFLLLLLATSLGDFWVGWQLGRTRAKRKRKQLIALSLLANLGLLATFKYFDFFASELSRAFSGVGVQLDMPTLGLVLPVGISFYTFQALSYTLDVYARKLEPTDDAVAFLAFICFFPQLVAGPIERATRLLPQMLAPRRFDTDAAADGLRQMLWGLFKKVVIADGCAVLVDDIFNGAHYLPGPLLLMGAVLFAMQIYGDFSGYSDIAIGCARLFGFDLMRNFAYPYFSRDIAEFWRRWHISLSTWFRDHLYLPLGGSKGSTWLRVRNTVVVFLVSGLWHGANWTFLVWGALNAFFFLPLLLRGNNRAHTGPISPGRLLPSGGDAFRMACTFSLTCLAWVFFRADSLPNAITYLHRAAVGTWTHIGSPATGQFLLERFQTLPAVACIPLLIAVEWHQRNGLHGLARMPRTRAVRWMLYTLLVCTIAFAGVLEERQFIYFQF